MNSQTDEIFNLARLDRARYLSVLTAPRSVRMALLTLLAFDLEIAKIPKMVSEPMIGRIRLQWWLDEMNKITNGQSTAHPIAEHLGFLNFEKQKLINLIEARNFEFETSPVTLKTLTDYAADTGGALQLAMLDVLGVDHIEARQAAADIGTAHVLIGFFYGDEIEETSLNKQAVQDQIESLLISARKPELPRYIRKKAMPALVLARLLDRQLQRGLMANEGPGAVMSVWWTKINKSY